MNATSRQPTAGFNWWRLVIPLLAGGVTGFAVARIVGDGLEWAQIAEVLPTERLAGAAIGWIALVVAIVCYAVSFSDKAVARSYAVAPDEDLTEEIALLRWSSLSALFYALFMLAMSFEAALSDAAAVAAMAGSLLGAIAVNAYLWRRYDELWREITAQACTVTFTLFHYVLLGWAGLAILLDGDAGFGPVNVTAALLAVFILASIRATARRGMVHMP